jgi:hypothetical protein
MSSVQRLPPILAKFLSSKQQRDWLIAGPSFFALVYSQCFFVARTKMAEIDRVHPSGAVKIPREYAYLSPYVWFPDCKRCLGGKSFAHERLGEGISQQCHACYHRYLQWLKDHQLIRYVMHGYNYPIRTKIDTTKGLIKSNGRIFYQEVDYAACEGVRVEAYAVDSQGNGQEHLWIEGRYSHYFPTLPDAQAWIAQQMGGLRMFWLV